MESDSEERTLIERYLLGETTEGETEGVEKRMMTDDSFFHLVISQEEELVERYAHGDMTEEARERFEQSYLSSPDGRDEVTITKELLQRTSKDAEPGPANSADIGEGGVLLTASRDQYEGLAAEARPESVPGIGEAGAWSTLLHSPYLRVAAMIVILVAVGFGVYWLFIYKSDVDKGLAELKGLYKDQRPTEARVAEFDYAPWSASRGGDSGQGPERDDRAYAESLLIGATRKSPSAEAYRALGLFYLTGRQFDMAVAQFELSARYAPPDARLHGDWGAALLERGLGGDVNNSGRVVEDFSNSLDHLQKALEMDPSRLDALFNLALLYEAQGMAERAKEAWEEYLRKDKDSKWAGEARERLQRLEQGRRVSLLSKEELLAEFINAYKEGEPQRAWTLLSRSREPLSGKPVPEQLLDLYIDDSLNGREAESQYDLKVLSFAGELEVHNAKDQYARALEEFYKSRPIGDLQLLKQARDLTRQGHAHYAEHRLDRAIEAHTEARNIFNKLGDLPEAAASNCWIAYCQTGAPNKKAGLLLANNLRSYCYQNKFRWLFMRCLLAMAAGYYVEGEYSEAAKNYKASLELAEEMGDTVGVLGSLDSLTELYRFIGNYPRSFECIQRGFAYMLTSPLNPIQRLRHYSIVASALDSAGLPAGALEYQKESLRGDLSSALSNMAIAYTHMAGLYAKQKKYDEAKESIGLAYEVAQRIGDQKLREDRLAYSSLYLAHIYRGDQDYDNAIATYTKVIETFDKLNIAVSLYQAHKGRLYCYLAKNDDRLIQEELGATLRILEGDRSKILEAENRNNFFDREQNVYDSAIEYAHFRLQDDDKAFEYSEAPRARSLLDMVRGSTAKVTSPLTLQEVASRLPEAVQLVQYSVLDANTVVWVISRGDVTSRVLEVGREKLEVIVKDYSQLISRRPGDNLDDMKHLSAELFDILINPILPLLRGDKIIYIVPDKALSYLPFESLISPSTGNYLIEDFDIAYAPSSSVLIACSEEERAKSAAGSWHILSVGNPAFDRGAYPGLEDLRSAKTEAETVARLYDTSAVLVEKKAQERRVKDEMGQADVVHIAAHAVLDEYASNQSKLLLASEAYNPDPGSGEDGVLNAGELYGIKLPRARLVILSSCHSGVDRYYKGEGMMSLARPFIAAKVPLVVASLWKVDTDFTADLMIDFHKERRRLKKPTVEALKEAKLKMLRGGPERYRHPYYWASFVAIGGHAYY